jgi:hypothetical protein
LSDASTKVAVLGEMIFLQFHRFITVSIINWIKLRYFSKQSHLNFLFYLERCRDDKILVSFAALQSFGKRILQLLFSCFVPVDWFFGANGLLVGVAVTFL